MDQIIREKAEEVIYIMKWFMSRNDRIKQLVILNGGWRNVSQEAYLFLLRYPPKTDCMVSTVACRAVRWTLARMVKKASDSGEFLNEVMRVQHVDELELSYHDKTAQSRLDADEIWEIVIKSLWPKYASILRSRMNGETLGVLAKEHSCSCEMIRMYVKKAVRKCSHYNIASKLIDFSDHRPEEDSSVAEVSAEEL